MAAIPIQRLMDTFPDRSLQLIPVQNPDSDCKIDAAGRLGQRMPVGQAGDLMDILHGPLGFGDVDTILFMQHKGHGQNPHQRTVAVFVHLVAAAEGRCTASPVTVDGPAAGMADVKLLAAGSIGTVANPVIKPRHDVMGMVIAHLADAVRQTQRHAAVIGPITGRLPVQAASNHLGNGIAPQIFSCSAFCGNAQSVCHTQAVKARSDHCHGH